MYELTIYESGRLTVTEQHKSLEQARLAAFEGLEEIKPTMKRIGAKKEGNLRRDNKIIFNHPAFGFEGGVYIHKLTYSRIEGWIRA